MWGCTSKHVSVRGCVATDPVTQNDLISFSCSPVGQSVKQVPGAKAKDLKPPVPCLETPSSTLKPTVLSGLSLTLISFFLLKDPGDSIGSAETTQNHLRVLTLLSLEGSSAM